MTTLADTSLANIVFASGNAGGIPLLVTGTTSGAAQLLGTAVAGTSNAEEWYIWASNNGAADVILSLEVGSATNTLKATIPGTGSSMGGWPVCIYPGIRCQNGTTFKVYAATGSVINVVTNVNGITQ